MLSQNQKIECRIHHSEAIAINLHPNTEQQEIIQCIYCLIGNLCRSIIPLKDIKKLVENFLTLKQQENYEVNQIKRFYLSKLLEKLTTIKKEIINLLDNGINIIKAQEVEDESINQQEEWNISQIDQIKQIILDYQYSYSQQQNKLNDLRWIQSLSEELQQINKFQEIQNCIDLLGDFKKEYQTKKELYQIDKLLQNKSDQQIFRDFSNNQTPKLNILCKNHQKEIIMIDMNQNIDKSMRLCCIECMPEKYLSLTQCKKSWNLIKQKERIYLQQQMIDMESQYNQVRDQNKNIELQIIEKIKGLRIQFEDYLSNKKIKIFTNINIEDEDWVNLTQEEVLERAEILSKTEESQDKMIQSEYQQICDQVLQQLYEQYKELKIQQQYLFDNLRLTLCHSQDMSKSESSSEQNCINSFKTGKESQEQIFFKSFEIGADNIQIKNRDDENFSSPKNNKYNEKKNDKEFIKYEDNISSQYKIIGEYNQEQNCYAISFNFDSTIMISGCQNDIIVWEFKSEKLQQIQNLQGHSNQVISLQFSANKNEFVSGSTDKTIRFWQQTNNLWICQQVLLGHKRQIDCLLMSNMDNQILSCSCDKTIRIWRINQQSQWIQIQTLTNHSAYVRCISLNKSQNQFVSCGEDKMILIWEFNKSQLWNLKQSIQNDDYGYRICFIGDLKIAWQPRNQNKTLFYEYDTNKQQFVLEKHQIILQESNEGYQNFFPSIYNDQKEVLINKHGQFVYILKMNMQNTLEITQIIDVGHYCNYGSLTQDGKFLVIWDEKSKCLLIRQSTF
ncbi:unnamed protein product [Paramecium sonneborni]|uniref:WD40-repeat-containing domain n=1 Tax=Paramecium sonneborni TaxID=65129 RepID=A0A8S1RI83_9CILI|nr:unnamed protein product [Paramecium sonneborni]